MFEGHLLHVLSGDGVVDRLVGVVYRLQHKGLPDVVNQLKVSGLEVSELGGLSQQGGDFIVNIKSGLKMSLK